jgi:hypothetical protein
MRSTAVVGLLLIVLGLAALAYQVISSRMAPLKISGISQAYKAPPVAMGCASTPKVVGTSPPVILVFKCSVWKENTWALFLCQGLPLALRFPDPTTRCSMRRARG